MHYTLGLKLEYVATIFEKKTATTKNDADADLNRKVTHYPVSKTKCAYELFPVIVSLIFTK